MRVLRLRTVVTHLTLSLVWLQGQIVEGQECVKTGQCRCSMSDESGEINLRSLASTNGAPRWTIDGGDKFEYSYNPCGGFTSEKFTDLAVHQVRINETHLEYDLGVQSNEVFETTTSSGTSAVYTSADLKRTSRVLLVCDLYAEEHQLEFVGELITLQYEFILAGPCACPGGCDDNGIAVATTTTTTTTTLTTTTTGLASTTGSNPTKKPDQTGFNWNQVGLDLVSLIFHDLILVVIIAGVYIVIKFFVASPTPVKSDSSNRSFSNQNFSNTGNDADGNIYVVNNDADV